MAPRMSDLFIMNLNNLSSGRQLYSLFCVIRMSITDLGVASDCVELGGTTAKVARMYQISNAVNAISSGMSGVTSMPVGVVDAGVAVGSLTCPKMSVILIVLSISLSLATKSPIVSLVAFFSTIFRTVLGPFWQINPIHTPCSAATILNACLADQARITPARHDWQLPTIWVLDPKYWKSKVPTTI